MREPIRAPRGAERTAKSWGAEAAKRICKLRFSRDAQRFNSDANFEKISF